MRLSVAVISMMIACLSFETHARAQQSYAYPGAISGVAAGVVGRYEMMASTAAQPTTWAPGSYVVTGSSTPPQQVLLPYSYYAVAPAPRAHLCAVRSE